jgi:hypothetical protein
MLHQGRGSGINVPSMPLAHLTELPRANAKRTTRPTGSTLNVKTRTHVPWVAFVANRSREQLAEFVEQLPKRGPGDDHLPVRLRDPLGPFGSVPSEVTPEQAQESPTPGDAVDAVEPHASHRGSGQRGGLADGQRIRQRRSRYPWVTLAMNPASELLPELSA